MACKFNKTQCFSPFLSMNIKKGAFLHLKYIYNRHSVAI